MTVRTRVKPRDTNFVRPEEVRLKRMEREQERGKNFLQKFLKKPGERKMVVGGLDGADDEGSELSDAPESEANHEDVIAQAEAQLLLARYA